jgi:hypothetical protein
VELMGPHPTDRPNGAGLYQIVCLSCGYRRAWTTLVDALADVITPRTSRQARGPHCRRPSNRYARRPAERGATQARNRAGRVSV